MTQRETIAPTRSVVRVEYVDSQPDSTDVRAPAGSAILRKGEPSATELARLQVSLTSDEDDRLDEVIEDSLKQYGELSSGGRGHVDEYITKITGVMQKNGWNTPVSEDHHSWEDSAGEKSGSRSPREPGGLRFPRFRHDIHVRQVGAF